MKKIFLAIGCLVGIVGYGQTIETVYFDRGRDVEVGERRVDADVNTEGCSNGRGRNAGSGKVIVTYTLTYFEPSLIAAGTRSVVMVKKYEKEIFKSYGCGSFPGDPSDDEWKYKTASLKKTYSYAPVNYTLTQSSDTVCSGTRVTLSDYLEEDTGGGTVWSGQHVSGGYFQTTEAGTYAVTAIRTNFANGDSKLILTILVPGITITAGAPLNVCHQDEFYRNNYNFLLSRPGSDKGEQPHNGATVAHGGRVVNVFYNSATFIKDKNDNGNYIGPYVDVTKPAGTYTGTYVAHVQYPNAMRCYYSAPKSIVIGTVPSGRTAGNAVSVCEGSNVPVLLSRGASANAEADTWEVQGLVSDKITEEVNRATADASGLKTGTYQVTLSYYASNCFSVHTKTLTINPVPGALSLPGSGRCGAGTVSLGATRVLTGLGSGNTLRWYDAEAGGNEVGRSGSTVQAVSSVVWWAEQVTSQGCSSPRVPDSVTVHAVPAVDAFSFTRCGAGEIAVDLNENNRFDGWQVNWYDQATGGQALSSVFSYKASFSALSTDRYLALTDPNGCSPMQRVAVTFEVLPRPDKPAVDSSGVCGSGTVTFTAPPANTLLGGYVWYGFEESLYADKLGEGELFTTDSLTESRNYYVAVKLNEESGGCESDRQEVRALVWPVPGAVTFSGSAQCGSGAVLLSADRVSTGLDAGNVVIWYDAEQGGDEVGRSGGTAHVDSSEVLWGLQGSVEGCVSLRSKDTITVHAVPEKPAIADVVKCGRPLEEVAFAVNLNENNRFDGWQGSWYRENEGGNILQEGFVYENSFDDPVNIRYVAFTDPNGCSPEERSRVVFRIKKKPNSPYIEDSGVCGSGAVVFDLPALTQGAYVWYEGGVESGLEAIDADEEEGTFTTAVLANTKTYYVTLRVGEEEDQCESDRLEVTALVWPVTGALSSQTVARCGPGRVTFTVVPGDGEVIWYREGNVIHTGDSYLTENLEESTTYGFRERSAQGCESAEALATAEIKTITAIDLGESASLCQGAEKVLLDAYLPGSLTPRQGSFVGAGVSVSEGKNYFFPAIAGVGSHAIKFELNVENERLYEEFCLTPGTKTFIVTKTGDVHKENFYIEADKEEVYFTDRVQFGLKSKDDEEVIIQRYDWDLGDTTRVKVEAPIHYYYSVGAKDVAVTAHLDGGCSFQVVAPQLVRVLGLKEDDRYTPPDVVTGLDEESVGSIGRRVWPNPVKEVLYVRVPRGSTVYVLCNQAGRKVAEGVLDDRYGSTQGLSLENQSNGLYYLKLKDQWYRVWKR